MVQASLSDMFAPEAQAGIRIFTGGKDSVDIADMSSDESDAILYCFDQNVKKIENISPKLAAALRPQRSAVVKWAQVAKGTFPQTKNFAYPGVAGGLGVHFLNPYLYKYSNAPNTNTGGHSWSDYSDSVIPGYGTWDLNMVAGNPTYVAGNGTYGYKGCDQTNCHSYVVLFQDGLIEIGTTPKVQQLFFKSDLLDTYTPISVQPLLSQSIEEGRAIYQYTTPGMMPLSHITGATVSVLPNQTGLSTMPLLGMVYYETDFNLESFPARTANIAVGA
jgi:hypothetical protein